MIYQVNENVYETEMKFGCGVNQMENGVFPMSDSGFTCLPISRKRSRDFASFDPLVLSFPNDQFVNQSQFNNQKGVFTFLDRDISMQIHQQQLEIERFVSQHTEKMRSEIESARRRISMRVIATAEEGMKRLRSKEDEVVSIGRLNYVLEEKVKSLNEDNQIWQQIAQTHEATANLLRRNLEQILTQLQHQQFHGGVATGATIDDEESCCGSNDNDHQTHQRTLAKVDIRNDSNDVKAYCASSNNKDDKNGRRLNRSCRNCGKEEMCTVILLPCRHLCICTVCESSINICPICKSTKNASLHVNIEWDMI